MQTDILKYILAKQAWAFENHLESAAGEPVFTSVLGKQLWYMKTAAGFPWDMNTIGEDFIRGSITENGYASPSAFKMSVAKSPGSVNGGILLMSRFFNEGGYNAPLITLDSTYRIYSDPTHFTALPLGQQTVNGVTLPCPIMTKLEGPYLTDFGGDLGKRWAMVNNYFWGPGFCNLERNSYVEDFGWVQWELWGTGASTAFKIVAYNLIKPGGSPLVNFPQTLPVIT